MKQSEVLIKTLKIQLKIRNISYKDLAKSLHLSESSIKRLFSQKSISLQRLEEICGLLQLTIFDLAKLSPMNRNSLSKKLSTKQENELAANFKLFFYFLLLLKGSSPEVIQKEMDLTSNESIKLLVKLDKINLIKLGVKNKIKLLVSNNIMWSLDGPLRKKFAGEIKSDFMNSDFKEKGEYMRPLRGIITQSTYQTIVKKFDRLLDEIEELLELDQDVDILGEEYAFLLAMRPWSITGSKKLYK